ncbi:MAG: hypothetical protein KDA31_04025 [Phycisphaerales bacterium]|nr:hypothetical protein [Phycisphaerales bacterium]MCB9835511.1 hypothetical protein [Phycisphaera sp.]
MNRKAAAALIGLCALTAGGWTATGLFQPEDADRMPEVAAEDFQAIDAVLTELYASISGPVGQERDRERMAAVFAEGARLCAMQPASKEFEAFKTLTMTPDEYADRSIPLLEKSGFTESEIGRTLEIYGTIAHAFSAYEGHYTNADGQNQHVKGINSIQLVKADGEWKVYTILWDQQWPGGRNPVPERYIENRQDANAHQLIHFVDPESLLNEQQVTASISAKDFTQLAGKQLVDDPAVDERLVRAGICPSCKKFFPLIGHGEIPALCPVCNADLRDFNSHGHG